MNTAKVLWARVGPLLGANGRRLGGSTRDSGSAGSRLTPPAPLGDRARAAVRGPWRMPARQTNRSSRLTRMRLECPHGTAPKTRAMPGPCHAAPHGSFRERGATARDGPWRRSSSGCFARSSARGSDRKSRMASSCIGSLALPSSVRVVGRTAPARLRVLASKGYECRRQFPVICENPAISQIASDCVSLDLTVRYMVR